MLEIIWIELAKNGQWLGGSPSLGYSRKRESCFDENGNEKAISFLVKELEEVNLVKIIFSTYLKQGSIHQTEKYLIKNNIVPPFWKVFCFNNYTKVFKNPLYVKSPDDVLKYLENN